MTAQLPVEARLVAARHALLRADPPAATDRVMTREQALRNRARRPRAFALWVLVVAVIYVVARQVSDDLRVHEALTGAVGVGFSVAAFPRSVGSTATSRREACDPHARLVGVDEYENSINLE